MGRVGGHPLSPQLEAARQNQPLRPWSPQRRRCNYLGFKRRPANSLGPLGPLLLGPHPGGGNFSPNRPALYARFQPFVMGNTEALAKVVRCFAAAVPRSSRRLPGSSPIRGRVGGLAKSPEDAAVMPIKASGQGSPLLQSVDGFPP